MTITPHHEMARVAHLSGVCVVPPKEDGTKAPLGLWLSYQSKMPTKQQIDAWYEDGRQGVGVVCGAVSGNLTMMEWENEDTWRLYRDSAESAGLGELLDRIATGWMERTPAGGIHIYYRCDDVRGNKKLARRPIDGGVEVLIETRGEGGYSVIAPSSGETHPSGRPYVIVSGSPETIETITPEEQRDLWQLASTFDEMEPQKSPEITYVGSLRPGDDFNQRASWRDILEPHGWTFLFERGGVWYVRRPGKDRGVSATVNWGGFDCLRNFSSSTPFDDKMYTKFSAYAILEHRGDFREAAKELVRQGYGDRDEQDRSIEVSWRQPDMIDRPGFPQFPVHALPESIRGFCRGVSESVQVPYDYPAMTMLGALSVAARGRFYVSVPGTDYAEPLVLQTVLFAESGTRKSGAFSIVKQPLTAYERQRRVDDEKEFLVWQGQYAALEKEITKAQKDSLNNPHGLMALIREQAELAAKRPVVTRLIADDVTPERLGIIISEQRGPIGVMAPEGGFFGNISGRYNQGIPNLEYVLRGHNGEPLIIDRMGREVIVPAAYVTIAISLQPELVRELSTVPGFKGKGMAARLLPSFPQSPVGDRDVRKSVPVDPDDRSIWRSVLMTILAQAEDCPVTEVGDPVPFEVVLGKRAVEVYYQYAEHVERQLAKGGGLYVIRDWGGKMVGHALRIAGLFHLVERGNDALAYPVSSGTLSRAIEVMEYFVPHARHFLGSLSGIVYGENLEEVMNVLRDMDEPIHRSSVLARLRTHKAFRGSRELIFEALDELELLGYIRIIPGAKAVIELNPSVGKMEPYVPFERR